MTGIIDLLCKYDRVYFFYGHFDCLVDCQNHEGIDPRIHTHIEYVMEKAFFYRAFDVIDWLLGIGHTVSHCFIRSPTRYLELACYHQYLNIWSFVDDFYMMVFLIKAAATGRLGLAKYLSKKLGYPSTVSYTAEMRDYLVSFSGPQPIKPKQYTFDIEIGSTLLDAYCMCPFDHAMGLLSFLSSWDKEHETPVAVDFTRIPGGPSVHPLLYGRDTLLFSAVKNFNPSTFMYLIKSQNMDMLTKKNGQTVIEYVNTHPVHATIKTFVKENYNLLQ